MPLGLYISVPFCRTKCTYCNFASDVFSRAAFQRYVDRVCADVEHVAQTAEQMGGHFQRAVDSIYLGGGTPTILDISHLERLFFTIAQNFEVEPGAEITMECAPGTLTPAVLESFKRTGVNRVSLGGAVIRGPGSAFGGTFTYARSDTAGHRKSAPGWDYKYQC